MLGTLKCVVTLMLFTIIPLALGNALRGSKMTRRYFSLLSSFMIGFELFTISVLYLENDLAVLIGVILFLIMFAVGFPMMYWFYPVLKRNIDMWMRSK